MIYLSDERQHAVVVLAALDGSSWETLAPALTPAPVPAGPALTADGRLVLADRAGSTIVVMTTAGEDPELLDPAGTPVGALKGPTGVTVDAGGAVYIADTGNHRIVRASCVDAPGWSAWGTPGTASPGGFLAPTGVAVDGAGRVLVTDPAAHRLVRFDDMTGLNWTELPLPAGATTPYGVRWDTAGALVTELATRSVLRLHPDDSASVLIDGTDELIAPVAAAADDGTVLVADAGAAQVTRWAAAGGGWQATGRLAGAPGALPGPEFTRLTGLAVS
ncbi:NHL repeat-containing protein [Kitasatospora sp. NBC_01560]|uniref:NHL repeat-containing protein n=1 Tax=Kitasatospora sp. NBC_01560 TaxID=2975965 RepID=UPI003863CF1C